MAVTPGLLPHPPRYSAAYRRTVVLLLMLAYTFNSADRSIISIIGQAMKVDLGLSDTQLGLLTGTAFALLYALSGMPLARLAERRNRVNLISIALVAWSALTALCGLAATFSQLLMIRVGVGCCEAGCSPAAHSLISDFIEPKRRATALSVYSCGISLGYVFGAILGGYFAMRHGWRTACFAVGLPGIGVAVILKLWLREPPRGCSDIGYDAAAAARRAAPFSWPREIEELRAVAHMLFLSRPVLHMVLGLTLASFASYGVYAFVPAFFSRAFGLNFEAVGVISALTGGVAVGFGILLGGAICDALAARSERAYAWVPALGLCLAIPFYAAAFGQIHWRAAAWLLAAAGFLQYVSFGPTLGVIQNVVATGRRATATAFVYILLNVLALGGGPLFTGRLIDGFAEWNYAHRDPHAAPASVSFKAACPGGRAPSAAGDAAQAVCKSALIEASERGILATVALYAWACVHYALAGRGIAGVLAAARARDAPADDHEAAGAQPLRAAASSVQSSST